MTLDQLKAIERTPIKAPLPCFGIEYDATDATCHACPHQAGCREHMGSRLHRVTLDKIVWDLVPGKLFVPSPFDAQDPEIPVMDALFTDCFKMVFDRRPRTGNTPGRYRARIIAQAKSLDFSLRLYMLANMVGWKLVNTIHQHENAEVDSINTEFSAKLLSQKRAIARAKEYAELCRTRYGTFSVQTLGLIDDSRELKENNTVEARLLASEVAAGCSIVSFKLNNGGPAYDHLFAEKELDLDPLWLATEIEYVERVLRRHMTKRFGTKMQNQHRHEVNHVMSFCKKHKGEARMAFLARQRIMPEAVRDVLIYFGYDEHDFTFPNKPVRNTLKFWSDLGRAMVAYNCWLLICGEEDSIYHRTRT